MLLLQRSSLRHRIDFAEHLGSSHRCTGSQGLRFCPFRNAATTQNLSCLEWKWLFLPLIWDIGNIYYINISIHISTWFHDFKEHHQASFCIQRVSSDFPYVSHCFIILLRFSSWMAWREVHSRVSGTSNRRFADRSRLSEVITLTYPTKKLTLDH